ncbi:MAG: DMT family transporter [Gemmatimonas sp.]
MPPRPGERRPSPPRRGRVTGLQQMAVGAFWFSLMSLTAKLAGRRLPSQELVLVRAVMTLGLSWWTLRRAGLSMWGEPRLQRFLWQRGVLGCLGLTCFFYSLVHLPLSDATLLQYTNPIWAALLAALLLGERITRRTALCLVASVVGVVMVVRPSALGALWGSAVVPLPSLATAVALVGAACSAGSYVTVRRMGRAEDPRRVVFYLPLVTVPLTLPFALPGWVWPTAQEWLLLTAMSVATQLAQTFMTKALQRETAARATAVGYLQLVFAAVWGALVFDDHPSGWSVAGAAIIVASTLLLAFRRKAPPRAEVVAAELAAANE